MVVHSAREPPNEFSRRCFRCAEGSAGHASTHTTPKGGIVVCAIEQKAIPTDIRLHASFCYQMWLLVSASVGPAHNRPLNCSKPRSTCNVLLAVRVVHGSKMPSYVIAPCISAIGKRQTCRKSILCCWRQTGLLTDTVSDLLPCMAPTYFLQREYKDYIPSASLERHVALN